MLKEITGKSYLAMLDSGINNLAKNRQALNDMNVFPVPDGDTGTNMVMTLKYGYQSLTEASDNLGEVSNQFASFAVFGARGNSGVILSQFFKGFSESFSGLEKADAQEFLVALKNGCMRAYSAVAKPVEGTMLTVVREAVAEVEKAMPMQDIAQLLKIFVYGASRSLENTPNLLTVLKKAGVVDSGGCGIVRLFEGFLSYATGNAISFDANEDQNCQVLDLSMINKDTNFDLGYCVEALLQLKIDAEDFDVNKFRKELSKHGNSVVANLEGDKVKMHVHVRKLASVLEYCQEFSEFITVKIENMSVQNLQQAPEECRKILVSEQQNENSNFSIVAVATNHYMQKKLIELGADVVIASEMAPSAQDFIEAFKNAKNKEIIVFPNSANSILTCVQASGLYKEKNLNIANSLSVAECYAALSVLDFDLSVQEAFSTIKDTVNNAYRVFVYHAVKDFLFGTTKLKKNDFFTAENTKSILKKGETLDEVVFETIAQTVKERGSEIVTIFYAGGMAEEYIQYLCKKIEELGLDVELTTVCTMESAYSLILMFE